ncbi:MAG: tail sheath protein [Frankiales bacterium]|nr:tail sheath protein [Frankiales bacterium]
MILTDAAPGVSYEAVDATGPGVTPLRTDIAAFVGIADRGPVDVPVPVESWQQFTSWFGGCTPVGFLAYAVRGFLENGGRRCWVVRVASDDPLVGAAPASALLSGPLGPVWRVRASSPGDWGNGLTLSLREHRRGQAHSSRGDDAGEWSEVDSTSGFARGSLIRVSQAGAPSRWHVAARSDAATGRLSWIDPEAARRAPGERPLTGFDPARPVLLEAVDYSLLVSERGRLLRSYDGLSLVPGTARYGPTALPPLAAPVDPRTGAADARAPEPVVVEELRDDPYVPAGLSADPAVLLRLTGGRPGLAALSERDLVGEPGAPDDGEVTAALKRRGLRAVEQVREVGLLGVPDVHVRPVEPTVSAPLPPCVPDPCLDDPAPAAAPQADPVDEQPPAFPLATVYRVQAEMVSQCERLADRFALLDPPYACLDPGQGLREVLDWRSRFDTSYASLTFPWLRVVDPVGGPGAVRLVPPSGHVAGMVAATDLAVGVHRAPANRAVEWTLGASGPVAEEHHALLNASGVNALRTVGGRGLRLLGARTLSSDPDWRYVNVRRLMSMVAEALDIALQWAVFEPNGLLTRARATMSATVLLDGLHEAGMLAGRTPEQSYFVRCDLDNNPPEERAVGRLLVEVGVAPSQPFEFVVLRVGRVSDALDVQESPAWTARAGAGA